MRSERSLVVAVVFGGLVGGLVYQFSLQSWFPALVVSTVYAGSAHFYMSFDISVLDTQLDFTDQGDKIGYAVGLFGLSVSPLALGEYTAPQESAAIGIVVWVLGIVCFLHFATTAAHRSSSTN